MKSTNLLLSKFQLIKQFGSWPLAPSTEGGMWDEAGWDLVASISQAHTTLGDGLFDMGISTDDKNSSLNRIVVCRWKEWGVLKNSYIIEVSYILCSLIYIEMSNYIGIFSS